MKKIVIVIFLLSFSFQKLVAQDPFVQSFRMSLFLGNRDIQIESFSKGRHLDFLNYMSFLDHFLIEFPYMGFSTHLQLRNGLQLDFKMYSNDDIYPTGGKVSAQYFFNDYWGLSLGAYGHPFSITGPEDFHASRDVEFHSWGTFELGRNIYELGWMVGPVLRYGAKGSFVDLKLNFGFTGFIPFKVDVLQEKINSNFRRILRYETSYDLQFFFFPELRAGMEVINFGNTAIGIQLQANYLVSRRSLNYTTTIFNWSMDNFEKETIDNPKHWFTFFNMDAGLFLRFNPRD